MNRRKFIRSLSRTAMVLPFADILALASPWQQQAPPDQPKKIGAQERSYDARPAPPPPGPKSPIESTPLGVSFVDVAKEAGLNVETIYGGVATNKYLLETTGCGLAFYDYDNDGWQDLFLVNGWRLEGFPAGQEPRCHLFKNNRDGTFTDVTKGTGLEHKTGWGQACCVGDYNNDGQDDLFVTYYGQNALYRNNGNGTFTDVTEQAGLIQPGPKIRWNTGCTFVDYDRDGHLDLFVANYVDFDLKTAPTPEDGPCTYKGILVACGPPGLPGGRNILYHNNGDGTFTDVSEKSGMWTAVGTYGLSVAASDLDNDGWPDIYVANDSAPATLYLNQKDGTFRDIAIEAGAALSAEAKPQAGMGVSIGDYNRDGNLDVVKTNFAGDTDSLYTNLGDAAFEDRTYPGGLGVNTRLLGWGVGFFDIDNDGWPDILMSNGHVYPEVDKSKADLKYAEHKYLYRNLRNGRFEEVTNEGGPGILENAPARGCAFGDYNNDGTIDVAVNCINALPQLLRCDSTLHRNWIKLKLVGVKSNRSGIGSRILVTATTTPGTKPLVQMDELRSGGSYFSQNDLRMHFGLDQATKVDMVEIRWLSGQVDQLKDLEVNQLYIIQEGGKILKSGPLNKSVAGLQDESIVAAMLNRALLSMLLLFSSAALAQTQYGTPASPKTMDRAQNGCPWLSEGSAATALHGDISVTVNVPNTSEGSCKFSRQQAPVDSLQILVSKTTLTACPAESMKLLGIGNEAARCKLHGSRGEAVEMVSSRVRDLHFTVTLISRGQKRPAKSPDPQQDALEQVAEQVAGSLY